MEDISRKFVWAFFPAFLVSLLVEFLIITSIISLKNSTLRSYGFGFLNVPIFRLFLITILLAFPSYFSVSYFIEIVKKIFKKREEIESPNIFPIKNISKPPSNVYWRGIINKFGVFWPCSYGTSRRGKSMYAYVNNPICPNCQTELIKKSEPKLLVLERKIWYCPDCREPFERPKDMLYKEKDAVENICEKEVELSFTKGEQYIEKSDAIYETHVWKKFQR